MHTALTEHRSPFINFLAATENHSMEKGKAGRRELSKGIG